MAASPGEVTRLLQELAERPESDVLEKLLPLVYDELRALAASYQRGERADHTLQPTALVHEAYLRLVGIHFSQFESRCQFFGLAATMMRRVLLDHAREHAAQKRGGHKTPLADDMAISPARMVDAIQLEDAMRKLENVDRELCQVFELRFFAGLSVEESAEFLHVSAPTVKRRWSAARAWLARELGGETRAQKA